MLQRLALLLVATTAASAQSSQNLACTAISPVANLLRINDEGIRYCSSILSIGTIVDPTYTTVTQIVNQPGDVTSLTITSFVNVLASAVTSYLTLPAVTIATTTVVAYVYSPIRSIYNLTSSKHVNSVCLHILGTNTQQSAPKRPSLPTENSHSFFFQGINGRTLWQIWPRSNVSWFTMGQLLQSILLLVGY